MKKLVLPLVVAVLLCLTGSTILVLLGVLGAGWHAALGFVIGYIVTQLMYK